MSLLRAGVMVVACAASLAACTSGSGEGGGRGPSGSGTSSASPSATEPSPALPPVRPATEAPRPREGRCYRLRFADAVASTSAVDASGCRRRHTSVTYHVGRLDTVVDGHLLAVDSRAVRRQLATECPARLAGFLGGDREDLRLSMLRATWFGPTIEQSDAGADWFRCDVIALAADERLATLESGLRGVLDRPEAARRYAMCGTSDPEDPDFRRVLCSARHSWVAISTVDLSRVSSDGGFPGARSLADAGGATCEDAARTLASDPLTVTWSVEPPTREQWRAGQQYGICWVPRSSA